MSKPFLAQLIELHNRKRGSRKKKRCISRIRSHMAFFGYDSSDLSDDEFENRVKVTAAAFNFMGISAEKAAQALEAFSQSINQFKGGKESK